MSQNENEPPQENPPEEQEQKQEEIPEIETSKETPIKRIFNHEKVEKYYKDQAPPSYSHKKFVDEVFPIVIDSLLDRSNKSIPDQDKINVQEIEWKRASELFKNLTLFPNNHIKLDNNDSEYIEFKINFKENKGELFSNYTHFFHAISLMASIPGLIEKIFRTESINDEGRYELFMYVNGEYTIVVLDDYLPVIKNTSFLRFSKPNKEEIWLPLLEKAYAKTHGGYGALITCDASSVVQSFTGVPVEKINIFDLDTEDLKITLKNNLENFVFLIPNDKKSKDIGIMPGKAYQLKELFDLGPITENKNDKKESKENNENKENIENNEEKKEEIEEKSNIILKLYNMFEYKQYKGKWSNEGDFFTEEIKKKVNFNPNDKNHLYMSLEYIKKFFSQIHIVYKLFDCNIKLLTVPRESVNIPQVFNLYIQNDAKVSFSLIFKDSQNSEESPYEQSLKKKQKIIPATICISEYNLEEKTFINFDGCFNSEEGPETVRNLTSGYYLIWTYIAYDYCSKPAPKEYALKVCSNDNFKLRLQALDTKYHLLKNILYSGIKKYQGQFMKNDEICVMDDNYYNFTGLGFLIIVNPFKEYYQKWIFKTQVKNMTLLYPYSKFEHFEIPVLPEKFFLLVGMKLDSTKKSTFSMKYYFKTLKYEEGLEEKPENIDINFEEFCSDEVGKDERDFHYYQYLNDEGIKLESQEFRADDIVYAHLYKNYQIYMDKIKEFESKLSQREENKLKYFEQKNLDGVYVGQVNERNIKNGRGAYINSNGSYFVGYWKDDKKHGKGREFNKNNEEIISGEYKNGVLNGNGKKIFEDGTKYEGMFYNGKPDGNGTYFFKDGTQWQGTSKKGLKEGKGTFIDAQGNKSDMEYHNNKQV